MDSRLQRISVAQVKDFAANALRVLVRLTAACLGWSLCALSPLLAQNPVPFVAQPLLPAAVGPGHAGFVLTVHGTGFVSGATVHWNGVPLAATFSSNSQLTANVPAGNVASAGTAQVTVLNPGNNTASNVVFFPVVMPVATVLYDHAPGSPIFQGGVDPHLVEPSSIATADFNGDGRLDLAVGVQVPAGPQSVKISLGNGDGSFSPASSLPTGNCPCSLAVGDLNADGKPDLVVVNYSDNNLTVLLGNGDGTFTPAGPATVVGANPTAVVLGDFNGDHNLDLAVTNSGDDTVSILLGNGDGTFTLVSSPAAPSNFGIAVGDFNGDGRLDLAVTSVEALELTILLGNGDGSFIPAPSPVAPLSESLVAADFNGDGKLDLAVSNWVDSTVSVLLGQGDGTFVPVNGCCGNAAGSTRTFAMATGDFNGDGKPDLVLAVQNSQAQSTQDYLSILLGSGDGTFVPTNFSRLLHSDVFSITTGDFNGDGRLDFATASEPENFVSVLLQTGLSSPVPDFGFTSSRLPVTVTAGDPANFATQVLSLNGFIGKISFQCSGAPQFAQCAFPGSVFLYDGVTASFNINVSTRSPNTPRAMVIPPEGGFLWWPATVLATLLGMMLVYPRRRAGLLATTVALGFVFLAGCGGSSMSPAPTGTPAGQYQLTVTATSGNITHSAVVTLIVK